MSNSPLKNIRKKCLQCCCGSTKAIKYCSVVDCPLWRFRFGLSPKTALRKYGGKLLDPRLLPSSNTDISSLP